MIKTLQKKFVFTAMTAISVLLLLLLGAINIGNIVMMERQTDHILMLISDNMGVYDNLPPWEKKEKRELPFRPRDDHDIFMSASFLKVQISQDGTVQRVESHRLVSVTEEEAAAMAQSVYTRQQATGHSGVFKYQMRRYTDGNLTIFFLDTSEQLYMMVRVLALSLGVGLLCWLLMLLLVILLSRRAIYPIAQSIERQKQFVTNAGHEIKTPLAIIAANTEAMELYQGESKWSKNIHTQVQRLNTLMQQLLQLSRMEEGGTEKVAAEFSFSALLVEAIRPFQEPLALRGVVLTVDIQPDVQLYADKDAILQLISILLDNAVKYSKDGGQVVVLLQKTERHPVLQIKNTCAALPDTAPERLFDRFYRGDAARTQKNGGYGIGLSMAQAIVAAHKGTITAAYIQPDWVCFTVRF